MIDVLKFLSQDELEAMVKAHGPEVVKAALKEGFVIGAIVCVGLYAASKTFKLRRMEANHGT